MVGTRKRLVVLLGLGSLAMHVCPALAETGDAAPQPSEPGDGITVIGRDTLLYPSAGEMNDHMHRRGELMVGLRYEHVGFGGSSQHGTDAVSDDDLSAAGYMMRDKSMTMDMVMLDLMYAPTDTITLTLSLQYVWNRMSMVGLDVTGGGMGSMDDMDDMDASMPMGEMKDSARGFGDTLVAGSLRLSDRKRFAAHATLGVWIPTGATRRKNQDGILLDYNMQPGSGTWDLEPSATVGGNEGRWGWGILGAYRFRAEARNDAGFGFGNKGRLSGWLSYLVLPSLGLTARAEYSHQGRIKGEFKAEHYDMMSPSDRPSNYGGTLVAGSLGANWQLPWHDARGPQLAVEVGIPLYQRVYGIQAPRDWRIATAIRQMF